MIHNTQRNPSENEPSRLPSSSEESSLPADVGSLESVLQSFLAHPDCSTAFALDQQLWTHLAGNNTRFWINHEDCQVVRDGPLYPPLDKAERETRVLKVSRSLKDGGNSFQADFMCVSLDEDPAYLAVSHVWGNPSVAGHFESHLENQERRATYNKGVLDIIDIILACGTTLYLWIDDICINQNDLDERASQVATMGTLYSQARQVVAFIGEADEMSNTAMKFILLTANCIWAHGSLSDLATASGWTVLLSEIRPITRDYQGLDFQALFPSPLDRSALTLFIDFICMVQKYPAFKSVVGSTFDASITAIECVPNTRGIPDARRGQRDDWPNMPFLYSLVSLSANHDYTDLRDRICALLGLAMAKRYKDSFRPNYEIKVEDVYVKVAWQTLIKDGNFRFLHCFRLGVGRRT